MKRLTIGCMNSSLLSATATGAMLLFMLAPSVAGATGTRAGTMINNTATASFDQGGVTTTLTSNNVALKVDELIDTTVKWEDPADVPTTPGATSQVLSYNVTNTGNGVETFGLSTISTVGGDQYDPTVTSIVIDNGNGIYEPGIDTVYTPGSGDIVLNPDQVQKVFVISTTPNNVADGNRGGVELVATSKTGTGNPGTIFAGKGEGGGDAIIGTTHGTANDTGYYKVAAATAAITKSAVVADPFGGTSPVPGATITYTIVTTVTGSGNLPNLRVSDAVPTGTTYVPNSVTLGGVAQTDASDGDATTFASNAFTVALGTVAGGQTRTVTFRVTIN